MELVKNTDHLRSLRDALEEENFGKRRGQLRKLAYAAMQACWTNGTVETLIATTALKGGLPARPTLSGLRDVLSEAALVNVAAFGNPALELVAEAIINPVTRGVRNEKSKSGYRFGEHRSMADQRDVVLAIKAELLARGVSCTHKTETETEVKMDEEMVVDIDSWKLDDLVIVAFRVSRLVSQAPSAIMRKFAEHAEDVAAARRAESVAVYIDTLDVIECDGYGERASAEPVPASHKPLVDVLAGMFGHEADPLDELEDGDVELLELPDSEERRGFVDMALKHVGLPELRLLIEEINVGRKTMAEVKRELEDLRKRSLIPATVGGSTPVIEASKGVPRGELVWRKAHDVFALKRGHETFGFEVPTWEWAGPHPHVQPIDEDYVFRPHELFRTLYGLVMNKPTYLHGHTGTGKTTLVEQVAARLGYPFFRINFDSEITRLDLIGRDTLVSEGGTTVSRFVDGVIPQYMVHPYVMCFDELDYVRPDVAYVMQRVLENDVLVLTEDGGRVVRPHPMMRLFATGNTVGQGDEHGMYQGARLQSMALLDRFTNWIEVDYLEPADREKLIRKASPTLNEAMVRRICQYVTEHLEAFKTSKVFQPISPRGYMSLAQGIATFMAYYPESSRSMAIKEALAASVLDRASQQDRVVLAGIIDRVFA